MADAHPPGVHAVTALLQVQDVQRSVEFYGKLGFALRNSFTPSGRTRPSWAWLASGPAHLMLGEAGEPAAAARDAVLLYLYCPAVEPFRSLLLGRGVEAGPVSYPPYAPRGEFRVIDPDGFVLMVSHT